MCPSYMASKNEKDTTRARANILREFLTNSDKLNRFDHKEIYEVMDLCLSCKACKSECPSNVDVAKLKAEFLQQYYDVNGVPFRSRLIANFSKSAKLDPYPSSKAPSWYSGVNRKTKDNRNVTSMKTSLSTIRVNPLLNHRLMKKRI